MKEMRCSAEILHRARQLHERATEVPLAYAGLSFAPEKKLPEVEQLQDTEPSSVGQRRQAADLVLFISS